MKKSLFCLAGLLFTSTIFCQDIYHFTKALTIEAASRYGREALYTDALLYRLYNNSLKPPVEGDSLPVGAKNHFVKWNSVDADSSNWFKGRGGYGGGGGYTYLAYNSQTARVALLNIKGNSAVVVNGVLHAGDPYAGGYLHIPVPLKIGLNEFYVRGTNISADLIFPSKQISLSADDPTLPYIVTGRDNSDLMGAVVIINSTAKELHGLKLKTILSGKEIITELPAIPALSSRKTLFHFNGSTVLSKGDYDCNIQLLANNKLVDEKKLTIAAVNPADKYSSTFISNIDGSLQYYAVTPQAPGAKEGSALFLSVHGAGVEAIGQARAYQPKDWGTLVAATNRRPRGFNWEDWGRLDALEVLSIAKEKFKPNPQRIYLTGHSMGGHGTWFLGATYPDKWAAIGVCSAYPTLKGYGSADGLIPASSNSPVEQMLLRSGNQSDVIKLAENYKPLGVYVLHGDADKVVSVNYARQMKKLLSDFHSDFSYYEYPNGEHWFGDQSVDWKPLFEFFKWHTLAADSAINEVDFITSNPGISDKYHWASVQQQLHPLQFSRLRLKRDRLAKTITGSTENIRLLKLEMTDFNAKDTVSITLDGSKVFYSVGGSSEVFLLRNNNVWAPVSKPPLTQKGPHRYGTFKDAFNNRMLFVYGTMGTKAENDWSLNKARYDAETWYYRGNGAVDIIADKDFSVEKYKDRGVILFGNKTTNAAWKILLADCPIQVARNKITAANKSWVGDDLSAYFVWPLGNSNIASVAAICGTGIKGMQAANANQYFAGASGFPDFMIFRMNMILSGTSEIKMAGFFDNDWKLSEEDFVQNN